MDVAVNRSHLKKDYFQSNSNGYFGDGGNVALPLSTSQRHFEIGRLSAEIVDNHVVVTFGAPFNTKPFCVNLKVYRMVENIPTAGKWIMQDVVHYFDDDEDWLITTGFSLFIDASEPLDGVILEYCFTE